MEQVYKVTTEGDCEGRSTETLGYATGNPDLIKMYYDEQKEYTIRLEAINIVHITKETASVREKLRTRRTEITQEMSKLEKELEKLGGE